MPGGRDLRIPISAKGGSEEPWQDDWVDTHTHAHTHPALLMIVVIVVVVLLLLLRLLLGILLLPLIVLLRGLSHVLGRNVAEAIPLA